MSGGGYGTKVNRDKQMTVLTTAPLVFWLCAQRWLVVVKTLKGRRLSGARRRRRRLSRLIDFSQVQTPNT